jgi:Leucine-rich repeat (LRR) protein
MRLSLHQNQLNRLPAELSNCEHLEVVSLFKNKLTSIPETVFTGWQKCKKLALQQNCLRELPVSLTFLVSIEELWIHGNNFNKLPLSINQLSQLQSLKTLWIDQRFLGECRNWQDELCNTSIEFV